MRNPLGFFRPKGVVREQKGITVLGVRREGRILKPPGTLAEYERIYRSDGIVNAAIEQTVAEAVGVGYFTVADDPRAKELVDKFAAEVDLDGLLQIVCRDMLIFGCCFVERIFAGKRLVNLKPLPATTMQIEAEPTGGITGFYQEVEGRRIRFEPEEIIFFRLNPTSVSPFGLSLIAPVYNTIRQLNEIDDDMLRIIKRYAAPRIIWTLPEGTGAEGVREFQRALEEIDVDQEIITTAGAQHDVIAIDPRGRFENYIEYLNQKIQTGLKTPLLSYLRNATEASATIMLDYFKEHVGMIQRYLKRKVEKEIFEPVVKAEGISEVPRLNFGMPRTGVEGLQIGDIAALARMDVGVLSPAQARDLLRKIGLPVEEEQIPGA
jgi:hypothetical protein